MSTAYEHVDGDWEDTIVAILQSYSTELWVAMLVFFVGGDLLTTAVGLTNGGVAEVGPVVGPIMNELGLYVMLPLKAVAIGACYAIWRVVPAPYDIGVPLGLAVFGVLVTGWNVGVLIVSTFLV